MEHFQTFLEALSHSIQFLKGQFYGALFLLVFSTSLKTLNSLKLSIDVFWSFKF